MLPPYTVGGAFTRGQFEAFSKSAFRYGSQPKIFLASNQASEVIELWGKQTYRSLEPLRRHSIDRSRDALPSLSEMPASNRIVAFPSRRRRARRGRNKHRGKIQRKAAAK